MTSFAVQSYTWLQQDPVQTSSEILERISQQLASFTIANGTVTSRIPNLSIANATSASSAVPNSAVSINILWVLSLTLSLLSALFAIAIQQWLRHLRPPAHLAMRTALMLRQFRFESLRRWQIPGIISLLPILVQVSVVLFLAGLMLLLNTLTNKVAIPFIAVAGLGVILFVIATLIPLFKVSCAYKSESTLIPVTLLHWTAYPFALSASLIGMLVVHIIEAPYLASFMSPFNSRQFYLTHVYFPTRRVTEYVRSFGARTFVDLNHFWTSRELRSIENNSEELDCRALCGSLLNMRPHHFAKVKDCMGVFTPAIRMRGALRAVLQVLGFDNVEDVLRVYPQLTGNVSLYHRAAQFASAQHVRLLLDALPQESSESDPLKELDVSRILVLLHQATKGHGTATGLRTSVLDRLCTIRNEQSANLRIITPKVSVPTLLIFEHYNGHFDHDDCFHELGMWEPCVR